MKRLLLFITTTMIVYGGGDITVVTPYETYDEIRADEEAVEYIPPMATPEPEIEEYIEPEPTPIATPIPTPVVAVPPVVEIPKEAIKESPPKENRITPNGFYAGIGISGTRYDNSCECVKSTGETKINHHEEKSFAVMARVGYDYNQYIGLEARGIKDVAGDDGASISHAGIFIKPMYPVTKELNVYGLVGMAKTKTSGDYPKVDSESLALGAGIEYDLSKDKPKNGKYNRDFDGAGDQEKGLGLFLDYERMVVKKDAPTLDAISAGVTYDF